MKTLFFIVVFFILQITPVQAKNYPAGTIGYLYNECTSAFQNTKTIKDFSLSYCGQYWEGYSLGAYLAALSTIRSTDAKPTLCDKMKLSQDNQYKLQTCTTFTVDKGIDKKHFPASALYYAAIQRKINSDGIAILDMPIKRLREVLFDTKICSSPFKESYLEALTPMNPALKKEDWVPYSNMTSKDKSILDEYEQCKENISSSQNDDKIFKTTPCAASIDGFIGGLDIIPKQYLKPIEDPLCKKEIEDFRVVDISKRFCTYGAISPLAVANLFVTGAESELRGNGKVSKDSSADNTQELSKVTGFGMAGYYPFYYDNESVCALKKNPLKIYRDLNQ